MQTLGEILRFIAQYDRPILEWLNFIALSLAVFGAGRTLLKSINGYLWAHDFTPVELQDGLNRIQSKYNVLISIAAITPNAILFVGAVIFLLSEDPAGHIYTSLPMVIGSLIYMIVATVLALIGVLQLMLTRALGRYYDAWQHGGAVVSSTKAANY